MDLKAAHDILTIDRLTGSRWIFANQHGLEYSRSFYFGTDGLIKVFRCANENSWTFEDGILRIFDDQGQLHSVFDVVVKSEDETVALFGKIQKPWPNMPWLSLCEFKKKISISVDVEAAEEAPVAAAAGSPEGVRLVIWDLDDTFWRGTLTEGGVVPVQDHIAIVETLGSRGIVSAICSKNHYDEAKNALVEHGCWDNFVLSQIAFSPKGALIKSIVKNSQLRPETILFIDDNPMNINEALHYVPNLQVAAPDLIPKMLDDPRFVGKPDPDKTRLARYKILETKLTDKSGSQGDNEQFLRASDIRVSLHTDVEQEFERIHDLVNRTNQLNFTKRRWPEDIEEARAQFRSEAGLFGMHCGYVKVADKYGDYGIVGFYMCVYGTAIHFLFSCRTLNMGVEQFVWRKIDRPHIDVVGDVVSDLDMEVDWITLVRDAQAGEPTGGKALTVCIRGACDLMMTSQFLRAKVNTIEEFNYIYRGWTIYSLPRTVASHGEMMQPENQAILSRLPATPKNFYASDIMECKADVYVLSFSQECFVGYYRVKATGLVLPLCHNQLWPHDHPKRDYTEVAYDELLAMGIAGIQRAQWDALREELELVGDYDEGRFVNDLRFIFDRLKAHGKEVIILGLNGKVGRNGFIMKFFTMINEITRPLAREYGFTFVDVAQFMQGEGDLNMDGMFDGTHFARHVYAKIADEILRHLSQPAMGMAA